MSDQQPQPLTIEVPSTDEGERIDRFLSNQSEVDLTRSKLQKLIIEGHVTVNGKLAAKNYKVRSGDSIVLSVPPPETTKIEPENIPLDIIYEDDHLAVVNKPAGMVTHPAVGHRSGTLVNGLLYHFKNLPDTLGIERAGIVHRLDKNTTGLLLVAKTEKVQVALQSALKERTIKRAYLGVVCGQMPEESGIIDAPIGRSTRDRKKMAVTNRGSREAQTGYTVKERFRCYQLLELQLQTGRTHQIRVHLAHIGHPVFGDPEYGGREKQITGLFAPERGPAKRFLSLIRRQALHAAKLEFVHPVTSEKIKLKANLPDDFAALLATLHESGQ